MGSIAIVSTQKPQVTGGTDIGGWDVRRAGFPALVIDLGGRGATTGGARPPLMRAERGVSA